MKNKLRKTSLSRIMVAGLFCGVAAAIIANVYFFFYTGLTDMESTLFFNPIIILISIPLTTVVASLIYYMIVNFFNKSEAFFVWLFVVIGLMSIIPVLNFQPSVERPFVTITGGLLLGIMGITYISISIFLPYLIHHPQIYRTYHQVNWYKHYKQ